MIAALLLAACIPLRTCDPHAIPPITTACATPTPTLQFDTTANVNLLGHKLYARKASEPYFLAAVMPCEPRDENEDGTNDARFCRGADMQIPVQRYCPACSDLELYEFAVSAYGASGESTLSNTVAMCMPITMEWGRR